MQNLSEFYSLLLMPSSSSQCFWEASGSKSSPFLSETESKQGNSWVVSWSSAHSQESPTARQQHWHPPSALCIGLGEETLFLSLEVPEVPYHPHTLAVLVFEISTSTAHQNWHSVADKKWAVTIKVACPTSIQKYQSWPFLVLMKLGAKDVWQNGLLELSLCFYLMENLSIF